MRTSATAASIIARNKVVLSYFRLQILNGRSCWAMVLWLAANWHEIPELKEWKPMPAKGISWILRNAGIDQRKLSAASKAYARRKKKEVIDDLSKEYDPASVGALREGAHSNVLSKALWYKEGDDEREFMTWQALAQRKRSPRHFWAWKTRKFDKPYSPRQALSYLAREHFFSPNLFYTPEMQSAEGCKYAVHAADGRTIKGKRETATAGEKGLKSISKADYGILKELERVQHDHSICAEARHDRFEKLVRICWRWHGLPCTAVVGGYGEHDKDLFILDYFLIEKADRWYISQALDTKSYDLAAAWYAEGIAATFNISPRIPKIVFFFQESTPPFEINAVTYREHNNLDYMMPNPYLDEQKQWIEHHLAAIVQEQKYGTDDTMLDGYYRRSFKESYPLRDITDRQTLPSARIF